MGRGDIFFPPLQCWGWNPWPHTCSAIALPLSYTPAPMYLTYHGLGDTFPSLLLGLPHMLYLTILLLRTVIEA